MNEARVLNLALIGIFLGILCAYIFTIHFSAAIIGSEQIMTTVSAFCG